MPEVALTVPAEYAERFHQNIIWRFESAASNVSDMARFAREQKRSWDDLQLDRALLDQCGRLLDQVGNEPAAVELDLTADPVIFRSILHGCLVEIGEDLHGQCEDAVFPFERFETTVGEANWIAAKLRALGEPQHKLEAVSA
jgi:hypothetical protein